MCGDLPFYIFRSEEFDLKSVLMNRLLRITALFLAVLLFSCSLVGCAARALPTTEEDLRVVGTIGEYEVLYEEFRFLVLTYKKQLEDLNGTDIWDDEETATQYLRELKELVYTDLEANYAVLTLAAKEGLSIDEYDKAVQEYIEKTLDADFGGDRESYKDFLKAMNLTDHYVRFTAAVDAIYKDLYFIYLENGKVPSDKEAVKQYILENFVYVASICLVNKTDGEYEGNGERAQQYRDEVADGADINEYVKYTLDISPEHCFTRGEMGEVYEEKAFALENVGDVSEVFLGTADYLGNTRSAWYFLQRLALSESYVDANYPALFDQYTSALMNDYLNEAKETLAFVPNDYCKGLDLLAVEPVDEVKDNTGLLVGIGISCGVLVIVAAVVLFKVLNRKPAPKKKHVEK